MQDVGPVFAQTLRRADLLLANGEGMLEGGAGGDEVQGRGFIAEHLQAAYEACVAGTVFAAHIRVTF